MAKKDVPTATSKERLGVVTERVRRAGSDAVVVIDEQRIVLGLLRAKELAMDPGLTVEAVMRPGPSTFRPYVPIKEMADYMTKKDLASAPITTSDGKLVGLLLRADAVAQAEGCEDCARKMI
ncbi:MAG TPA: CBS domain-containing protein [Candidatus Dormibacteraeota bacterium]|nr:CBS domain-containing protein [Candidatus Dormibacteraeota bacterium]